MKADFLEQRAKAFLENARDLIKKGIYPLAAFNLEQACQLYLKYFLFLKLRRYPKTHFLKSLLTALGKAYKKEKAVERMKEENINLISDLEQAYITSRYLPAEFTKKQVENMLDFVTNLIKFLKKL